MAFRRLTRKSVFVSCSRDMASAVPVIAGVIDAINRNLAPGDRWSVEYWQRSDTVWSSEKSWQEHITRPSDPLRGLVICLFGERLGEPLPSYFPWPDDLELPDWACWPEPVAGKVQVTGTLFELIDAVNGPKSAGTDRKTLTLFKIAALDFARGNTEARDRAYGFNHEWDRMCLGARRPSRQLEAAYDRQIEQLDLMAERYFRQEQRPWIAYGSADQSPDECLEELRRLLSEQLPRLLGVDDAPKAQKVAKGLLSYGPEDADVLFGRDASIERVFKRLASLAQSKDRPGPFLLLTGRSGEGKSSVLRAGLVGRLRKGSYGDSLGPFIAIDVEARHLAQSSTESALADVIQAAAGEPLFGGHGINDFAPEQRRTKLAAGIAALLDRRLSIGGRKPRLFIGLDQVDDVLAQAENEPAVREQLRDIFSLLGELVDTGHVWVVAAVSTEMLDRLNRVMSGALLSVDELTRPGEEELREAIERSFIAFKLPEDELERILTEGVLWLRSEKDPGPVLPLLSALMAELQRAAKERSKSPIGDDMWGSGELTLAGVLDRLGERAWREATGGTDIGWSQRLERLLRQLVVTQLGEDLTLGLRECDENHPAILANPELVQCLRNQRLLFRTANGKYRLPHASIIRSWRRAKNWYEEDQRHQITLAELESKVARSRDAVAAGKAWRLVEDDADLDRIEDLWFHWLNNPDRLPVDFMRACLLRSAERFASSGKFERSDGGSRFSMAIAIDDAQLVDQWMATVHQCEENNSRAVVNFKSLSSGSTALHNAAAFGSPSKVQWLLQHGADARASNKDGRTALHGAAASGNIEAVNLLAGLSDLEAKTSNGWTALHFASHFGHVDTIRSLIDKAAANPEAQALDLKRPLHVAARAGHDEAVRALLSKVSPDTKSERGRTALHLASEKGHECVVEVLIEAGANVDARMELEFTALHLAAHFGHENVVRVLLKHADVEARTAAQRTPLHFAAQAGHLGVVRILLERADPASRTGDQFTALHLAVENGHAETAKFLLEKVDPDGGSKSGWTALHLAAFRGREDMVHLLLKRANVNARTTLGATPLFIAVEGGHISLVEELLLAGADPEISADGISPMSVAVAFNRKRIVDLLLNTGAQTEGAAGAIARYLSDPTLSLNGILHQDGLRLSADAMKELHEAVRARKPCDYSAWRGVIESATKALDGDPTWELMRMDALQTMDSREAVVAVAKARTSKPVSAPR